MHAAELGHASRTWPHPGRWWAPRSWWPAVSWSLTPWWSGAASWSLTPWWSGAGCWSARPWWSGAAWWSTQLRGTSRASAHCCPGLQSGQKQAHPRLQHPRLQPKTACNRGSPRDNHSGGLAHGGGDGEPRSGRGGCARCGVHSCTQEQGLTAGHRASLTLSCQLLCNDVSVHSKWQQTRQTHPESWSAPRWWWRAAWRWAPRSAPRSWWRAASWWAPRWWSCAGSRSAPRSWSDAASWSWLRPRQN